ncbi:hypothetical protein [Flavobacterium sp. GT3R68]|uniref:hypothetical protein n=1 Tax=Flavobacterium sp. GT3R68 TaxID=2594437 RepID=UPI000F893B26|nr:hypothetical protein [Flavobacterium sp. GT3R68]RTY93680.1 hypothetical protein EKL32_15255 [Flavobacterium sp. GSN2]TRW91598.1 hypothetical protein FNW07_06830 [Flavobacterium sp. GT3R68]
MKTILLLTTIMFLSYSCTEQELEMEQNTAFATANKMLVGEFPGEIKTVYFQCWVAGVRGGGSGTDFYIELAKPLPKGVVMSQVYFRDKREPITMTDETHCEASFRNELNNDNEYTFLSKTKSEAPVKAIHSLSPDDTQAVIVYYEDDVLKSYLLLAVKEIPPIMYP